MTASLQCKGPNATDASRSRPNGQQIGWNAFALPQNPYQNASVPPTPPLLDTQQSSGYINHDANANVGLVPVGPNGAQMSLLSQAMQQHMARQQGANVGQRTGPTGQFVSGAQGWNDLGGPDSQTSPGFPGPGSPYAQTMAGHPGPFHQPSSFQHPTQMGSFTDLSQSHSRRASGYATGQSSAAPSAGPSRAPSPSHSIAATPTAHSGSYMGSVYPNDANAMMQGHSRMAMSAAPASPYIQSPQAMNQGHPSQQQAYGTPPVPGLLQQQVPQGQAGQFTSYRQPQETLLSPEVAPAGFSGFFGASSVPHSDSPPAARKQNSVSKSHNVSSRTSVAEESGRSRQSTAFSDEFGGQPLAGNLNMSRRGSAGAGDAEEDEDLDPEEMSKKDPLATQVWRMYAKQRSQLPNGARMEVSVALGLVCHISLFTVY